MSAPPGVILAGGQGLRMGPGDKTLRPLAGQPLLAHVIARMAPQLGSLALNANGDPARFAEFTLPVLPDSVDGFPGPLAGVLAAMDWAAGLGAGQVITVPGDTPFLPGDLAPRLRLAAELAGAPGALAALGGADGAVSVQPACGLWPVAARGRLRAALAAGHRKVRLFAEAEGMVRAVFPGAAGDPFFNVNTPEDLVRAEAALAGA
ncbi:molybdenum cofactor guanylyltransferase MobA [Pseudooceanicola sp. CBS1P-1]|uniref:Molybdenum cofactor guanylyltransferase n=1 Tax=Pseudooceanicola albus TaxID=2692189 RepID=A0A6L7G2K9_9RHOB|nr:MULTISPECIES: molybdenum cofactor guanylyltransferase MobA [Pseudooceanicola]MBT9384847.1 molybdenum cofactor guanylyltransferase MobA [Pseudooceanicola endophyticus]MXN18159.1 molybdenum cofactor guanylyltransferase MobA [Pseudooceanicola albus]